MIPMFRPTNLRNSQSSVRLLVPKGRATNNLGKFLRAEGPAVCIAQFERSELASEVKGWELGPNTLVLPR